MYICALQILFIVTTSSDGCETLRNIGDKLLLKIALTFEVERRRRLLLLDGRSVPVGRTARRRVSPLLILPS